MVSITVYWITWQIGTAAYSELRGNGYHYEKGKRTCNETKNSIAVYNIMDLEDGWNQPEILADRLRLILGDIARGKRVIIMCAAGISRSNGMAMAVLSVYHRLAFDDAKRIVEALCPRANPMPDLVDALKEALNLINEDN